MFLYRFSLHLGILIHWATSTTLGSVFVFDHVVQRGVNASEEGHHYAVKNKLSFQIDSRNLRCDQINNLVHS